MTSWRDKENYEEDEEKHNSAFLSDDGDTSVRDLMKVLHQTKTNFRPLPGFDSKDSFQERHMIGVDCDEVYPNIFIGDAATAKDKQYLKKIGITHVLNTAEGSHFGMVNTSKEFYKGTGISYMGVHLLDLPMTNIAQHFQETSQFISDAIKSGGKILVHCLMGMSRSSTCVLAYLMMNEGFSAADALRRVRQSRDIRPNDGFMRQLAELDNKIRRERQRTSNL